MAVLTTINLLDFLSPDDQVTLQPLIDESCATTETAKKEGWRIDNFTPAFVDPFKALPELSTAFINLVKNSYSRVEIPGLNKHAKKRVNEGGNFCGHDPAVPYFIMRNHPYFARQSVDDLGNKRRSQILYDIVERIKVYYTDTDRIPSLHQANSHKRTSDRQRNSSRREALINLLTVMVMNMDLASLRVGQPKKGGGFFSYGLKWLARKAELSFSRAKRTMSDLNNSMIITSYQYRELINEKTKEYKAYNASRLFDMSFFRMLEIDEQKLGEARNYSYEKQLSNASAISKKEQAVFDLNMKKILKAADPNDKSLKKAHLAANEDERKKALRLAKKRNETLFALLEERPELRDDSVALDAAIEQRFKQLKL